MPDYANAACVDETTERWMQELRYVINAAFDDYDGRWITVEPLPGPDVARMLFFLTRTEQLPAAWVMAFAKRCLRANNITDEGHAAIALWLCRPPGLRVSPAVDHLVSLIKRSPVLFEMGCRS